MDINGSAGRKKYLTKTTVNLAMRENRNGESRAAVPTAIVLAVLIALFCKFGVIDPLMKASAAEQLVETESVALQSLEDANADYDGVLANYESLNISTVSVTGTMEPMECLSLIDSNLIAASKVEAYTVSQGVITVKISGVTLNSISDIYKSLMAYDSVENVQIYTAAKGEKGSGTTATLTIKLVSADDGTGDAQTSEAKGGGK